MKQIKNILEIIKNPENDFDERLADGYFSLRYSTGNRC